MTYLADWKKLKKSYEEDRKDAKKVVADAKKDLKKEKKKKNPDLDMIEDLEFKLDKEIAVRRKKTGVSPALAAYEKLLDKMEQMVANKVDPEDKKSWAPYVKALGKCRQSMHQANIVMQKNHGEVIQYTSSYARMYQNKAEKVLGKNSFQKLVGKDDASGDLIRGLEQIQMNIKGRLRAIQGYLSDGMEKW